MLFKILVVLHTLGATSNCMGRRLSSVGGDGITQSIAKS